MKTFSYIQIIISYLSFICLMIYYCFINKENNSPIDLVGGIILIVTILNLFIGLYILEKKEREDINNTLLQTILKHIVRIPV